MAANLDKTFQERMELIGLHMQRMQSCLHVLGSFLQGSSAVVSSTALAPFGLAEEVKQKSLVEEVAKVIGVYLCRLNNDFKVHATVS